MLTRVGHSGHLMYCYLENHQGRVVKYAIRNLDGDQYASGEKGGTGARGQVKLWVLVV